MSSSNNQGTALARPVELGQAVFCRVSAAADELGRIECLDDESRAEVHAILEAIRHEQQSSALPAAQWGTYAPSGRRGLDERARLQAHFVGIVKAIGEAADEFQHLASATPDTAAREQYERLAREELRHLELAERLVEIANE